MILIYPFLIKNTWWGNNRKPHLNLRRWDVKSAAISAGNSRRACSSALRTGGPCSATERAGRLGAGRTNKESSCRPFKWNACAENQRRSWKTRVKRLGTWWQRSTERTIMNLLEQPVLRRPRNRQTSRKRPQSRLLCVPPGDTGPAS